MQALEKLITGFKQFKQRYYVEEPELYEELLRQGQSPEVLVIACCDSRVHPAQVMNTDPGDIFVVRNVANLVPLYEEDGKSHGTSAALEFGVKHLKVKHIIVFGHANCGGVRSLMEGGVGSENGGFIDPWMRTATPARDKILESYSDLSFEQQCHLCEQFVIAISIQNLLTFPWIKSRVEAGDLTIHGWYFDLKIGKLLELNPTDDSFSIIM
ncbi:MAG: carbonic anhydrase [Gammaproteobacteria bacterium]|jgi:carbonic anhydrase